MLFERKLWNKGFGYKPLFHNFLSRHNHRRQSRQRLWHQHEIGKEGGFFFKRKLWNRGFGTETPIPKNFFKVFFFFFFFFFFSGKKYGIGVSVPKPLFHNFSSLFIVTILLLFYHYFLEKKYEIRSVLFFKRISDKI